MGLLNVSVAIPVALAIVVSSLDGDKNFPNFLPVQLLVLLEQNIACLGVQGESGGGPGV